MKITFLAIAVLVILTGCKDDPTAVDAWYAAHEKNLAHTESEVQKMGKLIETKDRLDLKAAYLVVIERLSIETNYQLLVDHARALKTRIGGGDVDADIKGHKGI
jgi:hypothetical protein